MTDVLEFVRNLSNDSLRKGALLLVKGSPGRTKRGEFSVLVTHLEVVQLAPEIVYPKRLLPRTRNTRITGTDRIVINRVESLYGQFFPLEDVDDCVDEIQHIDSQWESVYDPVQHIPDKEDSKRVAWALRKRPQIVWMTIKIRSLLQLRRQAGLPAQSILDIGGGRGDLALYLAQTLGPSEGVHVTIVDVNGASLQVCVVVVICDVYHSALGFMLSFLYRRDGSYFSMLLHTKKVSVYATSQYHYGSF